VLGSDGFIERLAGRIDHRAGEIEFPRPERLVHREPIEVFFPPAVKANRPLRNHRIRALVASGRYTVAEVGRHLGLHYSTVSRIGAREARMAPEVTIQDLTPG
jgi:hypothetical protein